MSDFGEGITLKTRKTHRCAWCGQSIDARTLAYHYKGMFDGDWQDWYMHQECERSYALDARDHDYMFEPYGNPRPEAITNTR